MEVSSIRDYTQVPEAADMKETAEDDLVQEYPTRQVDYLSHDWREEDISASWKYVKAKRKLCDNSSRLENASWRTWAKSKLGRQTVPPESISWQVYTTCSSSMARPCLLMTQQEKRLGCYLAIWSISMQECGTIWR